MTDRLTDLALAALLALLALQLAPRLSAPGHATEATFGTGATPVVSAYDETWEATEFLGHEPSADLDFKAAEGASRPFVTADVPQKFFDRNTPLRTRVVWRREEANSALLSTLMVTKWRVTGHIHAQ